REAARQRRAAHHGRLGSPELPGAQQMHRRVAGPLPRPLGHPTARHRLPTRQGPVLELNATGGRPAARVLTGTGRTRLNRTPSRTAHGDANDTAQSDTARRSPAASTAPHRRRTRPIAGTATNRAPENRAVPSVASAP